MKRTSKVQTSFFAALLVAVLSHAAMVHATVVVALTRSELTLRSARVVRATIGAQQSMWNEDRSQIVTLTTLRVTETWRGAPTTTLTLRQFGGVVGDIHSAIPGDGRLSPGQDVVLFLRERNGFVFLTALAQSVYYIDSSQGTPRVSRSLNELSFAERGSDNVLRVDTREHSESSETLAALRADVTRIARGAQ